MLERNDELIEQFNKEAQKKQRLLRRKLLRRKRVPKLSKRVLKTLDKLDESREWRMPVDCISKKWVG